MTVMFRECYGCFGPSSHRSIFAGKWAYRESNDLVDLGKRKVIYRLNFGCSQHTVALQNLKKSKLANKRRNQTLPSASSLQSIKQQPALLFIMPTLDKRQPM